MISRSLNCAARKDTEDIKNQKQSIQQQIDLINMQLAQEDANERIDQQIEELKASIVNYEQAKADAEKILYQLDLVGKKKNELLTEEINKHFKIVKWKLFDYMKNGNYEECCIPMIDGEFTEYQQIPAEKSRQGSISYMDYSAFMIRQFRCSSMAQKQSIAAILRLMMVRS